MRNRLKSNAFWFMLATIMIFGPTAGWAGFICNGWVTNGLASNGLGANALPANGLAIHGTTDIVGFSVARDQLTAVVVFKATVNRTPLSQKMLIPFKIIDATCDVLKLQLDPYEFDFDRMHIKINLVNHEIRPSQSPNSKLRELLCLYANMKIRQALPKDWAEKLDQLREL